MTVSFEYRDDLLVEKTVVTPSMDKHELAIISRFIRYGLKQKSETLFHIFRLFTNCLTIQHNKHFNIFSCTIHASNSNIFEHILGIVITSIFAQ